MAKVLYSATMSLDGFISGAGGDMSWLKPFLGPDPTADALVERIGALLVGNRTFGGDDPNRGTEQEGAFGGAWSGPQFVLTHGSPPPAGDDITFVHDLATGVAMAKAAAGDRYVNVLGADVARQCVEANVLDEVLVFVAPVLLGAGTRLFEHAGGTNVRLERIEVASAPNATCLWFRVAGY